MVQSGNALLLILALRDGELSMLYPIIALTYVWVNLLSMYFFHDQINLLKSAGNRCWSSAAWHCWDEPVRDR